MASKMKTGRSKDSRALDPGSGAARAQGCICSPERNNDGQGVNTDKGLTFYPNNDCPLHGLEAAMKLLVKQGSKPVKP